MAAVLIPETGIEDPAAAGARFLPDLVFPGSPRPTRRSSTRQSRFFVVPGARPLTSSLSQGIYGKGNVRAVWEGRVTVSVEGDDVE